MTAAQPTPEQVAEQLASGERHRRLIEKAWGDPALRPLLKKHVKDLFPETHLVDDDFDAVTAPLREENKALAKKLDDLTALITKRDEDDAKTKKERDDASFAARMEEARRQFSLTDEGFEAMKKRMLDTHAFDPLAAAAYIVSQTPPSLPPGPLHGSAMLNFANSGEASDDELYKLLHSGLDGPGKYLDAHIRQAWDPRTAKDYVGREMGRTYAELAFAA